VGERHDWIEELQAAVTVTDAGGTILAMNRRSVESFAEDGGAALIGSDVFACHPEPSRSQLREMFTERRANHYTITKRGARRIIHQLPWFRDGAFAGFVEITVEIPEELPHFDRG
jgi:transcriptional regulator with PAS, ATPase and Fis domain